MLLDNNGLIKTDSNEMANILQSQFSSVFSDPTAPHVRDPDFVVPDIEQPLRDNELALCEEDILKAINQIPSNSACGPDGIPVVLLKNCDSELVSPLMIIWSESMDSGVVPQFYKETFVTPLFKKGNRTLASNYRPVALTSHVIKIYERVLRQKMVAFIETNGILGDNQHGFRSGRSCLTQLLGHYDDIMNGLINDKDVDAIFLDYAKAFDKVDHRLLLLKLERYGFNEKIVKWVESFLSNRTQHVVVNGALSLAAIILSGVPQGSVLGPLLFILFINDMESCVNHSKIRFFADDTRMLKHISSCEDTVELQEDLDNVIQWARRNNMALHENKFELMIHKSCPNSLLYEFPFQNETMTYVTSGGDTLYPVNELRDLGVTVSDDLGWSTHVNALSIKARSIASWALSAFKARDKLTMMTLYKSLIRSHLEYCCPLWNIWNIAAHYGIARRYQTCS